MDGVNGLEKKEMNSKKLKVLCLHGFRTGGSFLRKQIGKWDPSIFQDFLLDFPDGIFLAGGKSDIEDIYPPPYFEWFQFNKDFTEYTNLEECILYLCDYMTKNGPFDGMLGFSQGATLSALLISYQAKGKILKDHPPIKFLVSISGCKFRDPKICDIAYKDPIKVKSVHFIGDKDWLRQPSEELTAAFDSPLILRHPQGHTVPRLDEINVKNLSEWTRSILKSSITYDAPGVETWKTEANNANIKQAVVADPKSMEATDSVLKATFTEG
ncbi:dihydrofolate reductase-like isoform X1 [Phoenix dactylifera]|uniref:Dihydrofolate reductase-like isoform X1 n=1 Tax=Phoenix dactylifera TaxID=42345 RepID=A0A8B8ZWS4_PHODC|nr:dihydrofolate reductase-like isoform X1 [Phoenix dactylifera]